VKIADLRAEILVPISMSRLSIAADLPRKMEQGEYVGLD
jgi:hypothetical protein